MTIAYKVSPGVGWQRLGLLTEQEKINLRTKRINPKTKSKLFTKIAKRMTAFQADLQLILECPLANEWKARNSHSINEIFRLYILVNSPPAQTLYVDSVHFVGRGNKKRYWVKIMGDGEERRYNITKYWKKLLEPEYSLRKIRNKSFLLFLYFPVFFLRK